jgi:hypothetical protein
MRAAAFSALILGLGLLLIPAELAAQKKAALPAAKEVAKAEEPKEEPYDQKKVDIEMVKSAGYADDVKSLTDFFRSHTVTEADKARINALIKRTGDDSFDVREATSEELSKCGVPAIALLKAAINQKDNDPEIVRRADLALKIIEKVPTRTLAAAAARLLAFHNEDGVTEVLINYLPLVDDESVGDEIRTTLTALAVRNGKPDAVLTTTLESKEALKRGAAAEAFARVNDKASREKMVAFLKTEPDSEVKLQIALPLVNDARNKEILPEVIRLMGEVSSDRGWRAEELLWRIAGEDGPAVTLGADKESREKARVEWKKWWDANEKKVDLARLDQESSYGLTIVCESPIRGGLGRVVAFGGDGKERWKIAQLNMPTDAVPLPGKKVLIAEHNRNRIVEREIDGTKEIWFETINQPVNCGRLQNGQTWAIGRNQIIEWERGDKSNKKHVFDFVRNEYDIVAGSRMKNGEYVLLTQNQQLLKVDRKGTIVKSNTINGNGVNYYATAEILPSGKVLCTLMNSVTEFDVDSGKAGWTAAYPQATSAVRLRNGNTLVAQQNQGKIIELDKDGKATKNEIKGSDTAYRPFRAFKR